MMLSTIRRRFTLVFLSLSLLFLTMLLPVNRLDNTAFAHTKAVQCIQGKLCSLKLSSSRQTAVPTSNTSSFTVNANQDIPGLDTGIDVAVGSSITFNASGQASFGPNSNQDCSTTEQTIPDGERITANGTLCPRKVDSSAVLPTSPVGEMIASIGSSGWFAVGSSDGFTASVSGRLFLLYNDVSGEYYDNSGSYQVTITTSSSSILSLQKVWTRNVSGKDATSFVPGEAIQYSTIVNNPGANPITATFHFEAWEGSNQNKIRDFIVNNITIPTGLSGWYLSSLVPGDSQFGTYTIQIDVWDQSNTQNQAIKQGQFSIDTDNLPLPSVWNSKLCDTGQYAYSSQLGTANYRGIPACGPRPLFDSPYKDVGTVTFVSGHASEPEWECTELSARFMYLTYGIPPYVANGDQVVDNYQKNNSDNRVLVPIQNNGTPGSLPVPGDILSYSFVHTSVVLATNVDDNGNGTIRVLEQNGDPKYESSSGVATLNVRNWSIASVKNWLHHTLNVWPQTASPGASVLVYGDGLQPDQAVNVYFDVFLSARVTTDSNGTFSTTITVPQAGSGQHYVFLVTSTSAPVTQTVFYTP